MGSYAWAERRRTKRKAAERLAAGWFGLGIVAPSILVMRTIKRYSNRKLYDSQGGHYVTLTQLAEIIRAGDDVQVLEHRSGRDLTAATMAQILFEEQKRDSRNGTGALREIIRTGQIP